jgi:DNA primase
MSMIPDEIIEQVRDAADIVGLIGESVELRKTGADWRGPCPFHGGKNRNFAVSPRRGSFYCFKCQEHGDVFSYLMKRFGMDYPTAVREIARRAGIVIPERAERAGPDPNERLFQAASAAHDWFRRQLAERPDAAGALEYLAGRGFTKETAAELELGWAPQAGRAFQEAMQALGIDEEVLLDAGLLVKRDDGSVGARFRNRLLFPIHDLRGRVVGFGGRLLGPGEPKYLNSPETRIFHKGHQLYNLHQAKQAIRKEGSVLLVEGYFDVLRLVLAGIDNVVAPLGTALTADQASLLRRYATQAVVLYDADKAGLKATFRAGDELLRQGVRVRVATMPPGEDPDTLVAKGGAAALEPILRDAVDVLERKLQLLERAGWLEDLEPRRGALDRLLPTIRSAADPITSELYLSLVSQKIGVGKDVLLREVRSGGRRPGAAGPAAAPSAPTPDGAGAPGARRSASASPRPPARAPFGARHEAQILEIMLATEDWWDRALAELTPADFEVERYRELFAAFAEKVRRYPGRQLPDGLSELQQTLWGRLIERVQSAGEQRLDDLYVGAVQTLRARPLLREHQRLKRLTGAAATPAEGADPFAAMLQLRERIRREYPLVWQGRFHKKANRSREERDGGAA